MFLKLHPALVIAVCFPYLHSPAVLTTGLAGVSKVPCTDDTALLPWRRVMGGP